MSGMRMVVNIALIIVFVMTFFLSQTLSGPQHHQGSLHTKSTQSEQQRANETSIRTEDAIARYTWWLAVFTFALVVATILLFISGGMAAKAALRQVKIMQTEQRAWLGAPYLTLLQKEQAFDFRIQLKNVGRTPSKGLLVDATVIPKRTPEDPYHWQTVARQMCKRLKEEITISAPDTFLISSIAPGDTVTTPMSEAPTAVANPGQITLESLRALKDPGVVGCALYGTHFDDIVHVSAFFAEILITQSDVSIGDRYTLHSD